MYTEEHLSEKSDFRALSEFALPLSFIWATIHHYIFFLSRVSATASGCDRANDSWGKTVRGPVLELSL
jgi:hypothetical protein